MKEEGCVEFRIRGDRDPAALGGAEATESDGETLRLRVVFERDEDG